ncbi:MAG TPA: putative addiction module antidote protein, partial [Thermoanaerobaculia bacterium]|nr:putative addiction module antidote protein [Thermoanaerobaculia bacterium]
MMEAVFLGGSRRIARLNDNIRSKLDELIGRGLWIFVGDANGADRAMQQHLADRRYERVVVYAVAGSLRNNVGDWKVCLVDPPKGARGFELYSAKDKQMASDASYGLMLWDGKSRGTLENVHNLLAQGKPVAVHLGPSRRFVGLKSTEDL